MKIILFTDSLGSGGAQRQLVGLAIMLKQRGLDVKVATYFDLDFYKPQLDEANVPNELIPGADNTKKRILAVRRYFKKEAPETVIAYQETPSLVASFARLLGCKFNLIVSERNTTQAIGNNERVRFFLYRWADHIVPNSYSQEKFLKEHYPWMTKKLCTITNFVDLEHFNYVERTKREVPEIVVAASIWASKNTIGLIEAIRVIKEKGLRFHVSWYGKSELNIAYFDRCNELIKNYGLGDYIELKEKTNKIREVYHTADFFCLPSFHEGTPNVLCEAISTGLPVICSDVCDNSKYAHEAENAYLFDPNSKNSIVKAFERLLSLDENRYLLFSKRSRQIAEKTLAKDVFLEKYIKLLAL